MTKHWYGIVKAVETGKEKLKLRWQLNPDWAPEP